MSVENEHKHLICSVRSPRPAVDANVEPLRCISHVRPGTVLPNRHSSNLKLTANDGSLHVVSQHGNYVRTTDKFYRRSSCLSRALLQSVGRCSRSFTAQKNLVCK